MKILLLILVLLLIVLSKDLQDKVIKYEREEIKIYHGKDIRRFEGGLIKL